jgi:hypothetical protein
VRCKKTLSLTWLPGNANKLRFLAARLVLAPKERSSHLPYRYLTSRTAWVTPNHRSRLASPTPILAIRQCLAPVLPRRQASCHRLGHELVARRSAVLLRARLGLPRGAAATADPCGLRGPGAAGAVDREPGRRGGRSAVPQRHLEASR